MDIRGLNETSQKLFKHIIEKDISAITDNEKIFLKARRAYLNDNQKLKYAHIINIVEVKEVKPINTYSELLAHARQLGYKGPRISKEKLQEYINSK